MARKTTRVPFQETVKLPARGITNGEESNPIDSVTLRAMTTMEEKMRLSSTSGYKIIPRLIKACLVDPSNLDVENMLMPDINVLMYRLRALTYGNEYKVQVYCPNEEKYVNTVVNLNEIPINYADETFTGVFELESLPISGDVLTCKMLSPKDMEKIDRECMRIRKKYPEYIGDPEMIVEWTYKITKINGDDKNPMEIRRYIEEMHARDLLFLEDKYNEAISGIGMDLNIIDVCPDCGGELEYTLPITTEFFRPRY